MWIRISCTPLTSTHSLLNPSRLHLLNILEIHGLLFCLHNKIQPRINLLGLVWCHFLHSALKPLVIRISSTTDSHYLQTVWLHLFLSSVPAAGSPAVSDSTQRCRRRCLSPAWPRTLEGRRAGSCLYCEFHTGNGCSGPKQATLCGSGGSPTAVRSSLPCRSNDLAFETPVPLMSCTVVMHMLD